MPTTRAQTQSNGNFASPRRILLISIPRTASNLLVTVLNIHEQPNIQTNPKAGYFLFPAFISAAKDGFMEKPAKKWTEEEKGQVKAVYQDCLDKLEQASTEAEEVNKRMFAKEHACWMSNPASFHKKLTGSHDEDFYKAFRIQIPEKYGSATYSPLNETIFSDEYLRSWQMVFIIRHPALTLPSFWRAMLRLSKAGIIEEESVRPTAVRNMDVRWSRMLYDWCLEQPGCSPPPVLDAYDLINDQEAVIEFCEQAGLDANALKFEWGAQKDAKFESSSWASNEAKSAAGDDMEGSHVRAANIMFQTLANSHGMVKDKTPTEVDIEAEKVKWRAEFGDEIGAIIEDLVWKSLPDYEYLKARRITGQVNHG